MDIAINSNSFITAARRALQILTQEVQSVILLNGGCWIFELTGVAAITASGTALTCLMLTHVPIFSDPASEDFISEPLAVWVAGGFICMVIAAAFMMVFDMVADTILYCHAVEMRRRAAPLGLYEGQQLMPCTRTCAQAPRRFITSPSFPELWYGPCRAATCRRP